MSTLNMKAVRWVADYAVERVDSGASFGLCNALMNAINPMLWYPDDPTAAACRFTEPELQQAGRLIETVLFDQITPPDSYPECNYWWPPAYRPITPTEYRRCILPRLIALDLIVLIIEDDRRREMRRKRRAKR